MKNFLVILIIILLFSCSEQRKSSEPISKINKQNNNFETNSRVFDIETNVDDLINDTKNKTYSIPNKLLAKALPNSLPGTHTHPFKYGSIQENNINITVVSKEYLYSSDSYLKISITDYYDYENIPKIERRGFETDLKISGKIYRKIIVKNNPAYIIEDENIKQAKLSLLYNKRIIIKIESFNLDKNKFLIDNFIRYININKLDDLIKHYK